jgi:hypothetical protein
LIPPDDDKKSNITENLPSSINLSQKRIENYGNVVINTYLHTVAIIAGFHLD